MGLGIRISTTNKDKAIAVRSDNLVSCLVFILILP